MAQGLLSHTIIPGVRDHPCFQDTMTAEEPFSQALQLDETGMRRGLAREEEGKIPSVPVVDLTDLDSE